MRPPAAYPFLRISKRYGIDYGDVLQFADALRHGDTTGFDHWGYDRLGAACEVEAANATMLRIQRGALDWQTGERIDAQVG